MARGSYGFEVDARGHAIDAIANRDRLRGLFRDGAIIGGRWGPGDAGDFEHGSWHILCHLVAAGALLDTATGHAWLAMGWDAAQGRYEAQISHRLADGSVERLAARNARGRALLGVATPLAFVEGTSLGRISARGVQDPSTAFNGSRRQDFDRDAGDPGDGGVVWEHWCTTRDLRPSSAIGTSVLEAYLTLVSILGGRFVAAVSRGRREHEHPRQLAALVAAGLLSRDEALWETTPVAIPAEAEALLYEARAESALRAGDLLLPLADAPPRYLMFARRIGSWSPTPTVRSNLALI